MLLTQLEVSYPIVQSEVSERVSFSRQNIDDVYQQNPYFFTTSLFSVLKGWSNTGKLIILYPFSAV